MKGILSFSLYLLLPTFAFAQTFMSLTDPKIAESNLNSQISSVEKLLTRSPGNAVFDAKYFDLLSARTQFFGTFVSDFATMSEIESRANDLKITAKYLKSVHQFKEAQEILGKLTSSVDSEPQLDYIQLATAQRLEELREKYKNKVQAIPTVSDCLFLANVEAELGNFEESDRNFQRALDLYRDSSPFTVAAIFFRRGVMWGERAGNACKAKEQYQQALKYLPQYVVANVHLAEIYREEGDTQKALDLLRSVANSEDPEPKGKLGELLLENGERKEGAALIASAKSTYETLLTRYPLAFLDHASEFYQGPGDSPKRALELALANLENRKDQRAYTVAIQAALSGGNTAVAKQLAKEARVLNPTSKPLLEVIASIE